MKRYVIDSISDIREFFTDLHLRTRTAFSPEDDLAAVVNANGIPVFSKAEVAYFDDIILDCFVFCNDYHLDLHDIVEGVQREACFLQPQSHADVSTLHLCYKTQPVMRPLFQNPISPVLQVHVEGV